MQNITLYVWSFSQYCDQILGIVSEMKESLRVTTFASEMKRAENPKYKSHVKFENLSGL